MGSVTNPYGEVTQLLSFQSMKMEVGMMIPLIWDSSFNQD